MTMRVFGGWESPVRMVLLTAHHTAFYPPAARSASIRGRSRLTRPAGIDTSPAHRRPSATTFLAQEGTFLVWTTGSTSPILIDADREQRRGRFLSRTGGNGRPTHLF